MTTLRSKNASESAASYRPNTEPESESQIGHLAAKPSAKLRRSGTGNPEELRVTSKLVSCPPGADALATQLQRRRTMALEHIESSAGEISAQLQGLSEQMATQVVPSKHDLVRLNSRISGVQRTLAQLGAQPLLATMYPSDFAVVNLSISSLAKSFAAFNAEASQLARREPAKVAPVLGAIADATRGLLGALNAGTAFAETPELRSFGAKREWLERHSPDGELGRFERLGNAYLWRRFTVPETDPQRDVKMRLFVMDDQFSGFDDGVNRSVAWTPVLGDQGRPIAWVTAASARSSGFSAQGVLEAAKQALIAGGDGLPSADQMASRILSDSKAGFSDTVDKLLGFATRDAVSSFLHSVFGAAGGDGPLPKPLRTILERFEVPKAYSSSDERAADLVGQRRNLGEQLRYGWIGLGKLSGRQMKIVNDFVSYVETLSVRVRHQFEASLAALGPETLAEHLAHRDSPAAQAPPASKVVGDLLAEMRQELSTIFTDDLQKMAKGKHELVTASGRFVGLIEGRTLSHRDLLGAVEAVVDQINLLCPDGLDDRKLNYLLERPLPLRKAVFSSVAELIKETYQGEYPKQISASTVLAHSGYSPVDSKREPPKSDNPQLLALAAKLKSGSKLSPLKADQVPREILAMVAWNLGASLVLLNNEAATLYLAASGGPNKGESPAEALARFEQLLESMTVRSLPEHPGAELRALLNGQFASTKGVDPYREQLLVAAESVDKSVAQRRAQLHRITAMVKEVGPSGGLPAIARGFQALLEPGLGQQGYWRAVEQCSSANTNLISDRRG